MLVITHYQRLLDYIVPDLVHVLSEGRIVRSGGKELALELEERGYGWLERRAARRAARGRERPRGGARSAGSASPRRAARARAAPSRRGSRRGARGASPPSPSAGLPSTRHEEWRYTNVAPLAAIAFEPAAARRRRGARGGRGDLLPGLRVQRLRVRRRPLRPGVSPRPSPAGVRVEEPRRRRWRPAGARRAGRPEAPPLRRAQHRALRGRRLPRRARGRRASPSRSTWCSSTTGRTGAPRQLSPRLPSWPARQPRPRGRRTTSTLGGGPALHQRRHRGHGRGGRGARARRSLQRESDATFHVGNLQVAASRATRASPRAR